MVYKRRETAVCYHHSTMPGSLHPPTNGSHTIDAAVGTNGSLNGKAKTFVPATTFHVPESATLLRRFIASHKGLDHLRWEQPEYSGMHAKRPTGMDTM
jgi:hypothetical protein